MLLEKKLLILATKQFTKYVDMNDNVYDRIPKGQYPSVYGFAADDAVNLSSPHCILPMLIKEYEETSYYCAADDDFLMQIYVYDDLATSKWQYAIFVVLTKLREAYAQKIYEPNRYMDKLSGTADRKLTPQYRLSFDYHFDRGWTCVAETVLGCTYDVALSAERDLFCKELITEMRRYMTTGRFVTANLAGVQITRKGLFRSYVDKRFGIYQIDMMADKPFEFRVTVYQK